MNILSKEKQEIVIGALAEGSSIRSIERMTNINRNTIMNLGVRVGKACERIMDEQMRGLACSQIQCDEIWGFVGKKQKNLRPSDNRYELGDVWTFVAVDAESRMAHAPINTAHQRIQQEKGKFQSCGRAAFRVLQLRADSQNLANDASNGGWCDEYPLERCRSCGRGMNQRLANIQKAVERAAECPATHVESVAVVEIFRGETIWEGVVEIFAFNGHPKAKRAYGWSDGQGKDARFTAVLEIPPVTSPNTAVRAAIVSSRKK